MLVGADLGTGIIEESGRGMVITNTDIWDHSTSSIFRLEGVFEGGGVGGLYMTGTNPHFYMSNVNIIANKGYTGVVPSSTSRIFGADHWCGLVWHNSDVNFGDATVRLDVAAAALSMVTTYDMDFTGTYWHGYTREAGLCDDIYDFFRYSLCLVPATYYAGLGWIWPTYGTKP
jgi:hypothetical protein